MNEMIGIARRRTNTDGRPDTRRLAELLSPRDILLDVEAPGKVELIAKIGEHMEWVHGIARNVVIASLLHREQIGSTAMGQGVAIPHARLAEIDGIQIAYLRLKTPVEFDAPDSKPVIDVFVILVSKVAQEVHLRILGEASQLFSDVPFRDQLHACTHPADVQLLIETRSRALR